MYNFFSPPGCHFKFSMQNTCLEFFDAVAECDNLSWTDESEVTRIEEQNQVFAQVVLVRHLLIGMRNCGYCYFKDVEKVIF